MVVLIAAAVAPTGTLANGKLDEILAGMGLKESTRAEELDVPTHVELAKRLSVALGSE